MTQLPPPSTAPAGWYADPDGHPVSRYFDGREWAPPTLFMPAPIGLAPPIAPHPSLPLSAAGGALVILLLSLVAGRLLVDVLTRFDWPLLVYVALLTAIAYGPSIAWCWYVSRRWGTGRLTADVGLRFRWSDAGWGPLIWIAAFVVQIGIAALVIAFDIPLTSNTERVSDIDADRAYVIALGITAVIAAPIVEEMVFRGIVMRGLRARLGAVATVTVQAVFFGAAHFDPVRGTGNIGLVMVLSAVGGALGLGAYLLRRIGPTILAHAIFNGVVLIIVLTGANERSDFDFEDDAARLALPRSAVVVPSATVSGVPEGGRADVTERRSVTDGRGADDRIRTRGREAAGRRVEDPVQPRRSTVGTAVPHAWFGRPAFAPGGGVDAGVDRLVAGREREDRVAVEQGV
jgi:membrane protease YdiL (CAAX protease family)